MLLVLSLLFLVGRCCARARLVERATTWPVSAREKLEGDSADPELGTQRPCSSPSSGEHSHRVQRVENVCRSRLLHFNPRVSCIYVKDLQDESAERKAAWWWQQEEFDQFLQMRVDIGKAYRTVAKKLGLDIMQVSSVGSHGDEGYLAMLEINPQLEGESRRGLGLGRRKQRAKNRDAYIAAVLAEQRRQLRAAACSLSAFTLDDERLAAATRRVSEKDLEYAQFLAKSHYEQGRAVEANEILGSHNTLSAAGDRPADVSAPSWDDDLATGIFDTPSMPSVESFGLNDENALQRQVSPSTRAFSSKGFGLSREKLQKVGLSVTGHAISRFGRLRQLNSGDDAESDVGETDDDGLKGNTERIAQYRHWRMGAPVRAGLLGFTDIQTYGTRNEYRTWRSWKPSQLPTTTGAQI
mmetsp:Transcript_153067/g.489195  ORF Transcript_153067/g.489195 Transcript_153067/m.489195 type:complete len:411 (+) Transcript_153067:709-1941(+)